MADETVAALVRGDLTLAARSGNGAVLEGVVMCAALWRELGFAASLLDAPWPQADEAARVGRGVVRQAVRERAERLGVGGQAGGRQGGEGAQQFASFHVEISLGVSGEGPGGRKTDGKDSAAQGV